MALEYGEAFDFPVWINRCGVLAGAGQFGTPEQGIFAYWINAHLRRRPLRYIGFDGLGQAGSGRFSSARSGCIAGDARCERERAAVAGSIPPAVVRLTAMSLAQLTAWCDDRFGPHAPQPDRTSQAVRHSMDDDGQSAVANEISAGSPKLRCRVFSTEIAGHARVNIRTGWS